MIGYSHQSINQADIDAVVEVLGLDYITQGPKVAEFEEKFAEKVGAKYAVAISSGTAALHAAMFSIDIKPGDEVIVPAITFVATANAVVYQGGTPVFADVDPDTLLIDCEDVERKITEKTKAIVPVDYAGQVADYGELKLIQNSSQYITIIADACHSVAYHEEALASCYSLHPTKHITTGEGGIFATNSKDTAGKVKQFCNHGRSDEGMVSLGYNYRISDIQCALGISQLDRLDQFIAKRKAIAKYYDEELNCEKLKQDSNNSSYHLYVVKVKAEQRDNFRQHLASRGVGTQVHYQPVNLEPYYNQPGICPVAKEEWRKIVSIPIHPSMTVDDVNTVIEAVNSFSK